MRLPADSPGFHSAGRPVDERPSPGVRAPTSAATERVAEDFSFDLPDRTIEVWQRRSRRQLTREGAREMAVNTSGFFKVLAEWAAEDQKHKVPSGVGSR